jgi:hypothetical protein
MNIEDLQAQLLRKMSDLEDERKRNAAAFEKERKELFDLSAIERTKQVEAYNKKLEEHKARQAAKDAEEVEKARKALTDKNQLEQKQYEVEETLRLQREKLAWLEQQIANAEFSEEQFKKTQESQRLSISNPVVISSDEGLPGESATGTDGNTQTEQMSDHLKHILRLANRT